MSPTRETLRTTESSNNTAVYEFIKSRVESAEPEVQLLVTRMLVESEGNQKKLFLGLASLLRDTPFIFPSARAVRERDIDAQKRVGTRVHEFASRDAAAMRPDENVASSALEWFFLTIPSLDMPTAEADWKRFCNRAQTIDKGDAGTLTIQSVIQNVLADEPRTKAFVFEVHERVTKLRARSEVPLTIYDIGCGPFPVLAISAAIASPDSHIVCIEKNPLSAEIATFILHQLGISNVRVVVGDALSENRFQGRQKPNIDLLISETFGSGLLDEPGIQIFKKYSAMLSEKGETIPMRTTTTATLMPVNKGVQIQDGVYKEKYTDGVCLNVDGTDLPIIPAHEWIKTDPPEINLSNIPDHASIKGVLPLPTDVSLNDIHNNYTLCIAAELDLGSRKLARYSSFPTFPIRTDIISIPQEFITANVDPSDLEVQFEYEPGSSSHMHKGRYTVVRKLS